MRRYVPPKRRFLKQIYGASSKKTPFFIVTAVKTSNLTDIMSFFHLEYSTCNRNFWSVAREHFEEIPLSTLLSPAAEHSVNRVVLLHMRHIREFTYNIESMMKYKTQACTSVYVFSSSC
jgi:hypothetical protein